jgi:gas vesicle protein
MPTDTDDFDLLPDIDVERGHFPSPLLALALGAGIGLLIAPAPGSDTRELLRGELADLRGGTAKAVERLQREIRRRRNRARRRAGLAALAGVVVGAGLAAILTPESGPTTRRRIVERIRHNARRTGEESQAEAPAPGQASEDLGQSRHVF